MTGATSLALRTGQNVLIDGRKAQAGTHVDDGRVFLFPETGDTIVYSNVAQVRMAREGRLTTQTAMNALTAGVRQAVETDYDVFAPEVREKFLWRRRFVMAVNELPVRDQRKKVKVKAAIEKVQKDETEKSIASVLTPANPDTKPVPLRPQPSVRMVLLWHKTFFATGKDVRSLADCSYLKGRGDQLPRMVREEIRKAIDEVYATQPPGGLAETRRRACTLIRARANREGKPVPQLGKKDLIGVNCVKRVIEADYEVHDVLVRRYGKAEADRIMEAVAVGPIATYPLQSVEIDHTHLDLLVVDEDQRAILGRPWLTVLLDRFSRCVIGFCLSFHPPSWTTVMEALRIAVSDKTPMLEALGGIRCTWDCFGAPDELVCDNGKEFHSVSMQATEAALNMRILYLPRKKGWLKGMIERWFGTLEREVVHKISGTTLANVAQRKHYDAEEAAVVTIHQMNWIVAKWIVDVYHQDDREGRRTPPADLWARGMKEWGAKPPPAPGLLTPLVGLTFTATLTREGIKAKCLRWNSNAFSALRNRLGADVEVLARIDPLDLAHASVLDPERRKWVEGDLQSQDVDAGLTLHQYEVVRSHAAKTREVGEDKKAALARARGEVFDFVDEVTSGLRKAKVGKRFLRFKADGRKAHEHVAPTRQDAARSAKPMGSHPVGVRTKNATPLVMTPVGIPAAGSQAATGPKPPTQRAQGATSPGVTTTGTTVTPLKVIARRPRKEGP